MSEKKTKNLGIRATDARWEVLNTLATKRHTSVQALVDEAVEKWLPDGSKEKRTKEESTYLDALLHILRAEDPESRGVAGSIKAILDKARPD